MKVMELAWVFKVDLQSSRPDKFGVLRKHLDLVLRQPQEISKWLWFRSIVDRDSGNLVNPFMRDTN